MAQLNGLEYIEEKYVPSKKLSTILSSFFNQIYSQELYKNILEILKKSISWEVIMYKAAHNVEENYFYLNLLFNKIQSIIDPDQNLMEFFKSVVTSIKAKMDSMDSMELIVLNFLKKFILIGGNLKQEIAVGTVVEVLEFKAVELKPIEANKKIILFIKILPLVVSILGFCVYYFLDDRFILYYNNNIYRKMVLKFYNGLFFDKLFIDVIVAKFYLFSYYSFYKNIESSFFQKYNIYIFEKNVYDYYFFLKIFSKGQFFVYILIVLFFMYLYFMIFFICKFLNFKFLPIIIILFSFSFLLKWTILKDSLKKKWSYL